MFRLRQSSLLLVVGAVALVGGGCQSPWTTADDGRPTKTSMVASSSRGRATGAAVVRRDSSTRIADQAVASEEKLPTPVDEALLVGVMEKVRQVSELDPSATPRLLAELQDMPPAFWPAAAEQFRSSLAYHQQLTARQSLTRSTPTANSTPRRENESHVVNGAAVAEPAQLPLLDTPAAQLAASQPRTADFEVVPANFTVPTMPPSGAAPGATVAGSVSSTHDWRELVRASAEDLGRRVSESPASTAEVHEHVTLRILRLLAGDTEQALEPIPGISPMEQDYWSRQLFALATYLDHHGQPDDKRRAAAGAIHLAEALNSLREVGSLSLRNLTFCKKVHAYGAYEPYEAARFSPGQQLTLYVEVENYHSQSTEKGFATLLGSSYEIVDDAGQRVAGDAFPDVNDTCRSRRRDFHIQYGVALPAKIAAGRYRLQLVVRDGQSDKIGNASVEFDVGEVKSLESRVESQKANVDRQSPGS